MGRNDELTITQRDYPNALRGKRPHDMASWLATCVPTAAAVWCADQAPTDARHAAFCLIVAIAAVVVAHGIRTLGAQRVARTRAQYPVAGTFARQSDLTTA